VYDKLLTDALRLSAGRRSDNNIVPLQPIPTFINETSGADRGLICGFQLSGTGRAHEISVDSMVESLARRDVITWLHFNLNDARARRWLVGAEFLPLALREMLQEHDENRRIEAVDGGLLLVMSDFTFEDDSDPSEVAPLWCWVGEHALITARLHPLKSVDELRLQLRSGANITAASAMELMAQLLEQRSQRLRQLANQMMAQLDDIEDEILAGNIAEQRGLLGRARRLCARLRRQFVPERGDMNKFLHRQSTGLGEVDQDVLQSATDSLGFVIEEIAELYERAKLLQEELASRLAENTGRNLYVLSILTAVFLPMTLVTGIFGMNVAGLPGLHAAGSFWWVMVLILAAGVVTLAALFWRRLL
jgi:zinc transporter